MAFTEGLFSLEVRDTFNWPLLLSKGVHCREVSIRVNVWKVGQDKKLWPRRDGHCRKVDIRGSTV